MTGRRARVCTALHRERARTAQVHIKNEVKHAERMAVRAKRMAPAENRYVRNLANIRLIQDYLIQAAEKRRVPCLSNSNVDVSVGVMHTTVLRALQRCGRCCAGGAGRSSGNSEQNVC